jgi:hypothetical protein
MHKYSSMPLGFDNDFPIFDQYCDKEEIFEIYEDFVTVENISHHDQEINEGNNQQNFIFQLEQQQREVFIWGFIDPIVDYLEFMSNIKVKIFLSDDDWFCHLFKLYFYMLWFPLFFGFRSRRLPVNQFISWLHWRFSFI